MTPANTTRYIVQTRDVDGSGRRTYKTLAGAVARFESMYGRTVGIAIEEQYYSRVDAGLPLPALETLNRLRAVSDYGTVVCLDIVRSLDI